MRFESESELCHAYRDSTIGVFDSEVLVGETVLGEAAPDGLEGARSLHADLVGHLPGSGDAVNILVECKQEFEHRGVGQLLLYDWLLQRDEMSRGLDLSIERRLVLGSEPPAVVPTVCGELNIEVCIPVQNGWQTITHGGVTDLSSASSTDSILEWLETERNATLTEDAEEQTLKTLVGDQLPDKTEEYLYREISTGGQLFSNVSSSFRSDAIAFDPVTEVFYVIEVKNQPNVSGFERALGQATLYASLFRYDWGLPSRRVIPTVLINRAPWLLDPIRAEKFDNKNEMVEAAIKNVDCAVVLYNKVEKY